MKRTRYLSALVCSWALCTPQVRYTSRILVNGLPAPVSSCIIWFDDGVLNSWALGQDNPSTQCIVGDVPEIWDGTYFIEVLFFVLLIGRTGDESDHDGPYNGVEMGC
jgi:hypothetical protein